MTTLELLERVFSGLLFYTGLIALTRLAGKRLAGQTTTFDLIVLISIATAVQSMLLGEGRAQQIVFLATVFTAHKLLALACARWSVLRELVRGKPRELIVDGRVIDEALRAESVTRDELLAGLRRLGFESPEQVHLAVLEETGHISAVPVDADNGSRGQPGVTGSTSLAGGAGEGRGR
jgi:uncharacterized membrane protein YcaP (DUF421 family)